MGSHLSGCCGVEKAPEKITINEVNGRSNGTAAAESQSLSAAKADASLPKSPAPEEVATFEKQMLKSMAIAVLLADGTALTCQIKLTLKGQHSLTISAEKNLRVIPLNELKAVLHGKDQLKRVETKAKLVDDPNCVALHMVSGNCIPLRFDEIHEKECFVAMMAKLRA